MTACGTKSSHEMTLIFSAAHVQDADALEHPIIVQEYVNHNARLVKVRYSADGELVGTDRARCT
jgi:hypothetical protein